LMEQYLRAALENITRYGDTDVFPFPVENHIFFDKPGEALEILKDRVHGLPLGDAGRSGLECVLACVRSRDR
jgi:hypothetical protein